MKFRIIRKGRGQVLWTLPNHKEVWATEAEMREFLDHPESFGAGLVSIYEKTYGTKWAAGCSCDHSAEFVARELASRHTDEALFIREGVKPPGRKAFSEWWENGGDTLVASFFAGAVTLASLAAMLKDWG